MAVVVFMRFSILAVVASAAAVLNSTWQAPMVPAIDDAPISPNNFRVYMTEFDMDKHFTNIGQNLTDCVEFEFDTVPFGYSAFFTLEELNLIRTDHLVREVEQVYMGSSPSTLLQDDPSVAEDDVAMELLNRTLARRIRQDSAGCNLHHVSENVKNPPGAAYDYVDNAGRNVNIWILDSGIYTEHNDFGGRAVNTVDYSGDGYIDDGNGHGTHVAGVAAGTKYGVAKNAALIGVKVSGSNKKTSSSKVEMGTMYVQNNLPPISPTCFGNVINFSLTTQLTIGLRDRINDLADRDGVKVVAAAGNNNQDVRGTAPARFAKVAAVASCDW